MTVTKLKQRSQFAGNFIARRRIGRSSCCPIPNQRAGWICWAWLSETNYLNWAGWSQIPGWHALGAGRIPKPQLLLAMVRFSMCTSDCSGPRIEIKVSLRQACVIPSNALWYRQASGAIKRQGGQWWNQRG